MLDKRVEKNKQNVVNLRDFLLKICANYRHYLNNEEIVNALASQGNLAKYENSEECIAPSSLNTLKRTSNKVFATGFEELDKLRLIAFEKLSNCSENNTPRNTKEYYKERAEKLEEALQQQMQINLIAVHELLSDIQLLKNIQNINEIKLIHNLCDKHMKRLQSHALNFSEFAILRKDNHLKLVKGSDDE